ncbi:unnamed protein product [Sphagnum balticum]
MECRATTTKVLGWKGKNGSRSLERKGEMTRKGPENAGPLERISWRTSVWEELEVTEELIELVMRINKDRVPLSLGRCWGVSIYFFSQCMVFQPAKVYEAGGGDGEVIDSVSDVAICKQGCHVFCIHELPHRATESQNALGL